MPQGGRALVASHAALEAALQLLAVEELADEDHLVDALLVSPPGPDGPVLAGAKVDHHVHALEDVLLVRALHAEDALGAVQVGALLLQQLRQPLVELLHVQGALQLDAHAADVVVVLVLVFVVVAGVFAVVVVAVVVVLMPVVRVVVVVVVLRVLAVVVVTVMLVLVAVAMIMVVMVVVAMVILLLQDQKVGVLLQHLLQVKGLDAQHLGEVHLGVLRLDDVRNLVDAPDALLDVRLLARVHEVRLVQQDAVRKRNLLDRLVDDAVLLLLVQVLHDMLGVHDGEDGVQAHAGLDLVVHKKGLRHGRGVRQAGRLHQDGVQLLLALHELGQDADEVAAHRAAYAAVVHLKDLLLGLHHQRVVDAHLAILVLHHRDLQAVVGLEDVVHEGGLPAAQEPRHHRYWDFRILFGHGRRLTRC
mmetsp:Transcript_29950/g.75126  ORF Transcript_29950/g.75126 Transcript_29950/m.75126 type:complete len:417 (+) Transcript_29950:116-1366(+)